MSERSGQRPAGARTDPAPTPYTSPVFITFEGADGAGKTTALAHVAEALRRAGRAVLTTREPGGAFDGAVRNLILSEEVAPRAEPLLFLADRAQHMATLVEPALARGETVLCDRHADSTLVYQAFVRGLDESFLRAANLFATGGRVPDLTILLDVPTETAAARLAGRGGENRFDAEGIAFHRAVRAGFLRLAAEEPGRVTVLDAGGDEATVGKLALAAVLDRLGAPHADPHPRTPGT